MRAVVQRVSRASVSVENRTVGEIGPGLLVLLGVARNDSQDDVDLLADKVANLRIFPDPAGQMNRSVLDTRGGVLVVSQFTLLGDARRGRRPSYLEAATPEAAKQLYGSFTAKLRETGLAVEEGVFRAEMDVTLINQGPVTILLDSRKGF